MIANLRESEAFSPGQITGFFQICDRPENPLHKGSRGAGVCLTRGVTTKVTVARSETTSVTISINGNVTNSALVSDHVVNHFLDLAAENYEVHVKHTVKIPIGSGFGSSGAGALSLAFALNDVLNLSLTPSKAAQIAHLAEIGCKTGLGTVLAETFGGLGIRIKPGAPEVGKVKFIALGKDLVVACLNLSSISTEKILSDVAFQQRINTFGGKLVDKLARYPSIRTFMGYSRQFSEYIGLIPEKLRVVLDETDSVGLICSIAMLGETIFSLVQPDQVEQIYEIYSKYAPSEQNIIMTNIDFKGARLL